VFRARRKEGDDTPGRQGCAGRLKIDAYCDRGRGGVGNSQDVRKCKDQKRQRRTFRTSPEQKICMTLRFTVDCFTVYKVPHWTDDPLFKAPPSLKHLGTLSGLCRDEVPRAKRKGVPLVNTPWDQVLQLVWRVGFALPQAHNPESIFEG